MATNMNHGIVKPHYRLLGMLLERRDLRSELAACALRPARPHNDHVISELEQQLQSLDDEIRTHQRYVWEMFVAEGRNPNELQSFIGDDLLEELAAVREPILRDGVS